MVIILLNWFSVESGFLPSVEATQGAQSDKFGARLVYLQQSKMTDKIWKRVRNGTSIVKSNKT